MILIHHMVLTSFKLLWLLQKMSLGSALPKIVHLNYLTMAVFFSCFGQFPCENCHA